MNTRLALGCLLLVGCAPQIFPLPMTAAELRTYDSGPALVAYLGQPDASPAVCSLDAQGPHVSTPSSKRRWSMVSPRASSRPIPGVAA